MTAKRWIADRLIGGINAAARLPGERFYRLYLDEVNRRFNDFGESVTAEIGGRSVAFACPNQLTRWRVETLRTKEPATLAWIDSFAPGVVLWDIGANIGLFSLYAAIARNCRVVAFEPAPANFALLCRNVVINGVGESVLPFSVALCAERRIDHLHMENSDPGGAFSAFGGIRKAALTLDCLGYSMDGFIADFDPPFPRHLKIDVDGIEDEIVAGARCTLADPRLLSLWVELDDRKPAAADRLTTTLAEAGFRRLSEYRSPLFPDSPARNVHFAR